MVVFISVICIVLGLAMFFGSMLLIITQKETKGVKNVVLTILYMCGLALSILFMASGTTILVMLSGGPGASNNCNTNSTWFYIPWMPYWIPRPIN